VTAALTRGTSARHCQPAFSLGPAASGWQTSALRAPDKGIILSRSPMSLTFKSALAVPFAAAVAVLPAQFAHPALAHPALTHAATSRGLATIRVMAVAEPLGRTQPTASTQLAATQAATATQVATVAAQAATAHGSRPHRSRRMRAYIWAAHQVGEPYCWGGTGGCFDCSGLVMASYSQEGIYFGRDTTEMLASSRLVRVSRRHARKGDLAFYGSGHVELVAGRRYTLGALVPGTLVGWHLRSPWWHPTMYFRVRGAG